MFFPSGDQIAAVGAGRDVRDLMRRSVQAAAFRGKIRHPDLRRIGRLRSEDQPFAIGRKPRPLFLVRRLIQAARFSAGGRHNPEMRNLRVRFQVHIDRVKHDPLAIRRWHRLADPFQLHHVFEGEGTFGARRSCARRRLRQERAGESERNDQDFPMHRWSPSECANSRRSRHRATARTLVIPSRADGEGPRSCNLRLLQPSEAHTISDVVVISAEGDLGPPLRSLAVYGARDDSGDASPFTPPLIPAGPSPSRDLQTR